MLLKLLHSFNKYGDLLFEKRVMFFAWLCYFLCSFNKRFRNISIIKITKIYEYYGKYDKAINTLERINNKDTDYNVMFQLANIYYLNKDITKSKKIFKKLLNKIILTNSRIDYQLIANLINIYNDNENYENSLMLIKRFIENKNIDTDIKYLFFNIGNTYLGLKDYNKAIEYYKHAIKVYNYNKIGIFYNLAKCYYQQEDYDNSIHFLNEALKHTDIKNDIADIEYAIGCSYEAKGEFKEAKHHFEKSLDNGNKNAEKMIEELSVTE